MAHTFTYITYAPRAEASNSRTHSRTHVSIGHPAPDGFRCQLYRTDDSPNSGPRRHYFSKLFRPAHLRRSRFEFWRRRMSTTTKRRWIYDGIQKWRTVSTRKGNICQRTNKPSVWWPRPETGDSCRASQSQQPPATRVDRSKWPGWWGAVGAILAPGQDFEPLARRSHLAMSYILWHCKLETE